MEEQQGRRSWHVGLIVFAILLGLRALYAGDIPFLSDEPDFLRLALGANQQGQLAEHALTGSFGVVYPPVIVWFYQLLLTLTLDFVAVATIKTLFVSAAMAVATWRLAALTKLPSWPLILLAVSPFLGFYDRLLWDSGFLTTMTAWMMAATASFLARPVPWRWLLLVAICVLAFHVHLLAVVPIFACAATLIVFRATWLREHILIATSAVVGGLVVSTPFLLAIAFERGDHTHPHPELAHALVGAFKGFLFWSHAGFEHFMPSFYRSSALLRGLQLATGGFAVAAGVAALLLVVILAARRSSPLASWSTGDQIAVLAASMALAQTALVGGLRLEPFWHFFNATSLGYFYLIWWGYARIRQRRWATPLLVAHTASVGVMTILLAIHIHEHHGNRTVRYGATLANQMDVANRLVQRAVSGVTISVDNYKRFPYALETLVYTRALQTGTRMAKGTERATVRYVDRDSDDGRIEVVFGE